MFYCHATGINFEDGNSRRKNMNIEWRKLKRQRKQENYEMPADCTEEKREENKKKWEDKEKIRIRERRRTKTMEKALEKAMETPP